MNVSAIYKWGGVAATAVLATTIASLMVVAADAPDIPPIALASVPLFAAAGGDKPAMALALSVEYPTVGAQYTAGGAVDATYTNANEYLGYHDAESCYTYNDAPTETRATGQTVADYKRFDRSGAAVGRMCADGFSGNFLNWATSSAIDMLRLALSGGDRSIDTATLTILQRAVLPDGDPVCMWNSSNFPAKQLQKNGGGNGRYWGAVPAAMITQAAGSDIWVANKLNRIYFGTGKAGDCANAGDYGLGAKQSSVGPVVEKKVPTSLPGDASPCADEDEACSFSGVLEVWFGRSNKWAVAPASDGAMCSEDVFGELSVSKKRCYTRPYAGAWKPPGGTLNSDGYFFSRVQVCNVAGATLLDVRDYGLCRKYPAGNFKPTGSIQKYSNQLRVAAFGYLLDQTASFSPGGRYGGVLRAPMKYVGAKTFDVAGQDNTAAGGNPNAEWNPLNGVFLANPDGDKTQNPGISGVINYLNKFGRTGPVPGRYKIYDPVGELHYEALRYLQGLQPSAKAVSGISTAMLDGFPVATTWTDPYGGGRSSTGDYSCLKSNIVTIGDVNSHDGDRLPSPSASGNVPNISYWRGIVQNFEKNVASSYLDGQDQSRVTGNPNPRNSNPVTVSTGSQILGSAYWSHTHDIRGAGWTGSPGQVRPGLRVKNFFFDVNEYGASNSASYRQNSNQFFTAAKYGGFESEASNAGGGPFNTFGNPFLRQDGSRDNNVWQDPARPGEARSFHLQSGARGVLSAFDSIFGLAVSAARSIAGSASSSRNLVQVGGTVYQASFDTSDWSGDVLSLPVGIGAGNIVTVGATPNWKAATRLAALPAPEVSRQIVVGRPGATSVPAASDFTWQAIDAALKDALAKATPEAAPDALAQDRLDFLRGDRSLEGTKFRARGSLLGDIVNSGVAFSGAPAPGLGFEADFSGFQVANATRVAAVFVGANDGMLHAFSAATGDELFAYIPSWMGPKLAALASPAYNVNHQNYVDASPTVADARVGSAGTAADWKTVLVSGTGGGGRGVFALNVTRPATFSAADVMWEFTQADDPDMGFVVGRPRIVKMRTSAPGKPATYRWFAAVASGVNNYVPDSAGVFSTTGRPALFLLALDKAIGSAWASSGSKPDYYKISFPVDSILASTLASGMLNFNVALGASGEVAQVYAGDLHGNLWKLDFSAHGAADWNVNSLSGFNSGDASSPVALPLFVARTSANAVQPITMAPSLLAGFAGKGGASRFVSFGTGKYLEAADRTSTAQNTIYTLHDDGFAEADNTPAGRGAISGRGRLVAGAINPATGAIVVAPFTWGRAANDLDVTQRSGWYVDFIGPGERQISNAVVLGDSLVFGSLIPSASGGPGSCAAAGGSGREYLVAIDTGAGTTQLSNVGLLGEPYVAMLPEATTYTTSLSTGQRSKTVVTQIIRQGSSGVTTSAQVTQTFVAGRLSWRQINNYRDLRNTP
jgi:type IV pilus assembly protein PilY1